MGKREKMKVITRTVGFFDFLFGVPKGSVNIPDSEVESMKYFEDVY